MSVRFRLSDFGRLVLLSILALLSAQISSAQESAQSSAATSSSSQSSVSSTDELQEGYIPEGAKAIATDELPDELPLDDDEELLEGKKREQAALSKVERQKKFKSALANLIANKGEISIQAAVDLPKVSEPTNLPELAELVQKPNMELWIRASLFDAIAATRSKLAIPILRFEYDHGDDAVKPLALEAMGNLGHPDAVPILSHVLLKNSNAQLQVVAASALGKIRSRFSVTPLESASAGAWFPITKVAADIALARLKGALPDTISPNIQLGRRLLLNFKGTPYYVYAPSLRLPNHSKPRLLVCIHDGNYDLAKLFKLCFETAKQLQSAVIAPLFDPMRFPEYGSFNLRGSRADLLLLELIDHVTKQCDLESRELFIFGNGVGGDFVSRFVAAYPARVARAAFFANNPIIPDYNRFFPFGFKTTPRAPDLKFDAVRLIKTEQAIISSRLSNFKKATEAFQFYRAHAQQRGTIAATAFREIKYTDDLELNYRVGSKFLFSAN